MKFEINIFVFMSFCCFQSSLKFDAQAMTSSDGETVPFIGITALEGPVEVGTTRRTGLGIYDVVLIGIRHLGS